MISDVEDAGQARGGGTSKAEMNIKFWTQLDILGTKYGRPRVFSSPVCGVAGNISLLALY